MAAISGTESLWSELVLRHRQFLIKQIEPDFGLVEKLYANEVLSDEEKADINAENTIYKRNSKLLECIKTREQYDGFTEALKSCNQTHVANYLEKNGIYAFDDDWPLLDRERSILRANHDNLIKLLEVQELLTLLYSGDVINSVQMDLISSKKTAYKKNGPLLDILSRRSIRDYKMTIRCLHATKQSHIAQILDEGGVLIRVHAEVPDNRTEDEIISQFASAMNNRSTEECHRILDGMINVIAMKKGKSIVVYVYCKTMDELLFLQELKTSGKLVIALQKLFIYVLHFAKFTQVTVEDPTFTEIQQRSQIEKMTATVDEEEYEKCKRYFVIEEERMNEVVSPQVQLGHIPLKRAKIVDSGCENEETEGNIGGDKVKPKGIYSDPLDLDIKNLPSELMDIIIRKSFLQSRLEENEMKHLTDKEVIIRLASVQFSWFQRIIKRRLKNQIWRHFSVICKRNDKTAAIIRNNRPFLECCIRSKGFIKQLKSFDCLNDVQMLMIKRHKFKSKPQQKNNVSNLLNIIRSCDKSIQMSFGRCLRQNGQEDAARVEMNGGVLIKADLKYYYARGTKLSSGQMVEKLKELIQENKNKTSCEDKKINRLKEKDIEIVGSYNDREAVVWIWCQSEEAFKYIQRADVFSTATKNLSQFTDSSPIISIELDQLKKEFVQNLLMLEIEENTEFLRNCMDPNVELLNRLRADGSLTRKEIHDIKQQQTNYQMNTELLKYIVTKLRGSQLIDALNETGQRDITLSLSIAPGTDHVSVIGLCDGSKITDEVLIISLQNPSEMYHVKDMPIHMNIEATAAVYHNTVYVIGLGTYADKIWKYKPKSGWIKCASLTQGRRRHSAAFVDQVLYICGGFVDKDKSVLDNVEAYSAVHNTCKSVGKLASPVQNSGNCVAYKKSLYIFGGADKDYKAISCVQVYDTVKNTCHLLSKPMPRGYNLMRAVLWRESVILLGESNCFIYYFSTETWQLREKFSSEVIHFGLALSNNRIYVIGGGSAKTDARGKRTVRCRDDIRSVEINEIIEDKPVQWEVHGRLPKPSLLFAFVKSELALKNEELDDNRRELGKKKEELANNNIKISRENHGLKVSPTDEKDVSEGTDNVLIIGLDDGSSIKDEVLTINLRNPSEMYHVEVVPTAIPKGATAAVYHNTVFAIGLGTYANEIRKYEYNLGWNICASLRQGRRRHSAAFVDEVLYICGGIVDRDKSVSDSVEAYNAVDNTCKSVGKLYIPVQGSGNCVAYKKSLYVFGGRDKDFVATSDVQVYDTAQNTCQLLSNPMPEAKGLIRVALWRDSVILLGHWNCFMYDFSTETWRVREDFKTNVAHFGLAVSNDRIYVIGGGTHTTDANGKGIWKCRDDIRSVAIEEIIEDKPARWRVHGRLPRPCLVYAFVHLNQQHDNTDEVGHET